MTHEVREVPPPTSLQGRAMYFGTRKNCIRFIEHHGLDWANTNTGERMMSAADVINEYLDRKAPMYLAAPWRHPSGVVRALWHKQNMWLAAEEMEGAERPSDKYDRASDAYYKQKARYERAVRDAWSSRQLERLSEGYDIPGITTSERLAS